jgi:excisionase family DNA binding protein
MKASATATSLRHRDRRPAAVGHAVEDDPLFSVKQAADYLGVSVSSLDRWRCYGTGPRFVKVGRKVVRYRRSALDAFLQERTCTSEPC